MRKPPFVLAAPGATWYFSVIVFVAALGFLRIALKANYSHGEELFAVLSILIPLGLSLLSLALALFHLARRRWWNVVAWLPVIASAILALRVASYVYFW